MVDMVIRMNRIFSQGGYNSSLPPSFLWETIIDPSVNDTLLMTRLINLGNFGRCSIVKVPLREFNSSTIDRFVHVALDVTSLSTGDVEITVHPKPYSSQRYIIADEALSATAQEPVPKYNKGLIVNKCSEPCVEYDVIGSSNANVEDKYGAELEIVADDDADELALIQKEQNEAFRRLRSEVIKYVLTYHADPRLLMQHLLEGKFVVNANGLSPLVVNGDTEIVLTGYDEVQVKMPAMCRAVYILFLCHHEQGIVLKEISDYQSELEDIYSVVKPGRDIERRRAIIEAVCDPLSNRLNECLSRIKKCFTIVMGNTQLVDNYCITGNPGQPYRINLPAEMITIPSVFK